MKLLFAIILGLPVLGSVSTIKIKMDAVKINFVADMQNTKGSISGFEATINFDRDNLAKSSIEGSVDVNTLKTGIEKRDEHLKIPTIR
ncbi:YceI family protein [Crocinitomix sp.]|nr:YceI family protein [Crocinitomix sp.]